MTTKIKGEKKQNEIMDFIIKYFTTHGYAPTIREIGDGVDLKSTSSVYHYMEILKDEGKIKTDIINGFSIPRAYTVVGYKFVKGD